MKNTQKPWNQQEYDNKQKEYKKLFDEIDQMDNPFDHPRYDELSYDDKDYFVDKLYPDIGF